MFRTSIIVSKDSKHKFGQKKKDSKHKLIPYA